MFKALILMVSLGELNANVFLQHVPVKSVDMSRELQESLRREVRRAIGNHKERHGDSRLDAIEEMLRPTFIAIPKKPAWELGPRGGTLHFASLVCATTWMVCERSGTGR